MAEGAPVARPDALLKDAIAGYQKGRNAFAAATAGQDRAQAGGIAVRGSGVIETEDLKIGLRAGRDGWSVRHSSQMSH